MYTAINSSCEHLGLSTIQGLVGLNLARTVSSRCNLLASGRGAWHEKLRELHNTRHPKHCGLRNRSTPSAAINLNARRSPKTTGDHSQIPRVSGCLRFHWVDVCKQLLYKQEQTQTTRQRIEITQSRMLGGQTRFPNYLRTPLVFYQILTQRCAESKQDATS